VSKCGIGDTIPCEPGVDIGNLGYMINGLGGGGGINGAEKNGGRERPKGGGPESKNKLER
jgi:hypothetical protein